MAIETVHAMGYIHRDLKPDNLHVAYPRLPATLPPLAYPTPPHSLSLLSPSQAAGLERPPEAHGPWAVQEGRRRHGRRVPRHDGARHVSRRRQQARNGARGQGQGRVQGPCTAACRALRLSAATQSSLANGRAHLCLAAQAFTLRSLARIERALHAAAPRLTRARCRRRPPLACA